MAEFGSGELDRDMWMRPNPGLTEQCDILRYAISVDGYRYAREVLGKDRFEMTNGLRARCSGSAMHTAQFIDLRLWLFFLQRAWRFTYQGGTMTTKGDDGIKVTAPLKSAPDDDEVAMLCALHLAICAAWEREWPTRSSSATANPFPS